MNGVRYKLVEAEVDFDHQCVRITTIQKEGKSAQAFTEFQKTNPEVHFPFPVESSL
jgi:hypothetical protein